MMVMTTAMTTAKIGRSMKKRLMFMARFSSAQLRSLGASFCSLVDR
jgi:hypothetical protein